MTISAHRLSPGYPCAFRDLKADMPPEVWDVFVKTLMRPQGFDERGRALFRETARQVADGLGAWLLTEYGYAAPVLPSYQSVMTHRRGDCVGCGTL